MTLYRRTLTRYCVAIPLGVARRTFLGNRSYKFKRYRNDAALKGLKGDRYFNIITLIIDYTLPERWKLLPR